MPISGREIGENLIFKYILRIIYIGTPDFAVASLKKLVDAGKNIVGVITAPDKPAGRNQKLKYSPIKEYALKEGLHLLQPSNLKDEAFLAELKSLKADLQIVVAFRMLPEVVWNMPPLGTFNLHASLLPNYRGAAPIHHAIINGETETGVSTFFLKHEIDTGNILLQEKVDIAPSDNVGILHDKLMNTGADLLLKTVNMIESGDVKPIPQEELAHGEELKHAPKIFKPFCEINWNADASSIHNKIRGLSPYPCAYCTVEISGEILQLKVYTSELDPENTSNTTVQVGNTKNQLGVSNNGGTVWLKEVQIQGKKQMCIADLLNGIRGNIKIIL